VSQAFFISHPEVLIDPDVPPPNWGLSPRGVERMAAFAHSAALGRIDEAWASEEVKAAEAAGVLAARLGLAVRHDAGLGENDRSATGFLPPEEFEQAADGFFAAPEQSVRGWETAADAQRRIVRTVEAILARRRGDGDLAMVAHGGVGTLLLCAFLNVPISRIHDQPRQGCCWRFDIATRRVLHAWKPFEET
jgi:broad specificity phosphatase PhoE